jgi:hypothetical protein
MFSVGGAVGAGYGPERAARGPALRAAALGMVTEVSIEKFQ